MRQRVEAQGQERTASFARGLAFTPLHVVEEDKQVHMHHDTLAEYLLRADERTRARKMDVHTRHRPHTCPELGPASSTTAKAANRRGNHMTTNSAAVGPAR